MESVSRIPRSVYTVLIVGFLLVLFFAFSFGFAYAQGSFGIGGGPSIELSPSFPKPHTPVTATLNAYSLDLAGGTVEWYFDGALLQGTRNMKQVTVTTGKLGTTHTLKAVAKPVSGAPVSITKTISSNSVDIIVEARTYTPPFYRGRALPTSETTVNVIAIPHVGKALDASSLSYRWTYLGSSISGGSVKGLQRTSFTVPTFGSGDLEVTVYNAEGDVIGKSSMMLTPTKPELRFYEENPLRGLNERAITGTLALVGDETTVHGEPYFLTSREGLRNVDFMWRINNADVTNTNTDPRTLTLRRTGGAGSARIGLDTILDTGIPTFVSGQFVINF